MNTKNTNTRRRTRASIVAGTVLTIAIIFCTSAMSAAGGSQVGTPRAGGTITVGSDLDVTTLDPMLMTIGTDELAGDLLYDSLVRRRKFGQPPMPLAAKSLTPSADLKTWIIKLRPGITFSDGTPLDAAAVKFNIDRIIDPKSTSVLKGTLSLITSVDVVDPLTVRVNLAGSWASFPYAMTFLLASPKAVTAEGADYATAPVGSGPYTLAEWVHGDHLTFVKRADWWGRNAGLAGAYPDKVVVRVIPNETTRNTALANGEIDMSLVPTYQTFKAALQSKGHTLAAISPPGAAPGWIVPFNLTNPVVSDRRVRVALAYSIKRGDLVKLDLGLTKVNPGPFHGTKWDNGTVYPGFNLAKAKAAAAAYRAKKGPIRLTLNIYNDPAAVKLAQALQTMWKAVGIETTIVNTDFNTLIGDVLAGKYQMFLTKSGFISPHPDFILPIFMSSKGGLLFTHKADPQIDQALQAARTTTNVAVQKAAYKVIDNKWAHDLIWLWLQTGIQGVVYRPCLHGSGLVGSALSNTGVPDLSTQVWTTCK